MSRKPSIWSRMHRVRRIIAMSMVVCYVLGQGIIPIPVISAKTDDTPYPCQNHACGCSSAAQCWKACCCFTKEQKIAWAKENNVAIPYHILGENPAVKENMIAENSRSTEHQESSTHPAGSGHHGSCCSKKSASGCCSHATTQRSCCSKKGQGQSVAKRSSRKDEAQTVAIKDVLACQGLQMMWVMSPPTLPTRPAEFGLSLSRTFEVLRWSDDALVSATRMPPIPPPRLG